MVATSVAASSHPHDTAKGHTDSNACRSSVTAAEAMAATLKQPGLGGSTGKVACCLAGHE